jgi:hypothetical protein
MAQQIGKASFAARRLSHQGNNVKKFRFRSSGAARPLNEIDGNWNSVANSVASAPKEETG